MELVTENIENTLNVFYDIHKKMRMDYKNIHITNDCIICDTSLSAKTITDKMKLFCKNNVKDVFNEFIDKFHNVIEGNTYIDFTELIDLYKEISEYHIRNYSIVEYLLDNPDRHHTVYEHYYAQIMFLSSLIYEKRNKDVLNIIEKSDPAMDICNLLLKRMPYCENTDIHSLISYLCQAIIATTVILMASDTTEDDRICKDVIACSRGVFKESFSVGIEKLYELIFFMVVMVEYTYGIFYLDKYEDANSVRADIESLKVIIGNFNSKDPEEIAREIEELINKKHKYCPTKDKLIDTIHSLMVRIGEINK